MTGFDYGNARLRAMRSRLLSKSEIEDLAQVASSQALINALAQTPYKRAIEAALVRTSGVDCVVEALSRDLVDTLGRVRQFYDGRAREMVDVLLVGYDVHNVKTILRGLAKQATPYEITAAIVPVGELGRGLLERLAGAPDPRAAIDMLASMRQSLANPLLRLRVRRPGASLFEMELALDQWRFQQAYISAKRLNRGTESLFLALDIEADLMNLLLVLRFVQAPAERRMLEKRLGTDDMSRLFVGPGRLSFPILLQVGEQSDFKSAIEILASTRYEAPLSAGLEGYARSRWLSEFEKQLRGFRLRQMVGLIAKDPLGLGVPLGYFALKTTEVSNIRWIARGMDLGLKPEVIKGELEFAT